MNESILGTLREMIGPQAEGNGFDTDIIIHANTAFMTFKQLGIGGAFSIKDDTAKWSDYISEESKFEAYKTLLYLMVLIVLDPPQSTTILQSYKDTIQELQCRLIYENETGGE